MCKISKSPILTGLLFFALFGALSLIGSSFAGAENHNSPDKLPGVSQGRRPPKPPRATLPQPDHSDAYRFQPTLPRPDQKNDDLWRPHKKSDKGHYHNRRPDRDGYYPDGCRKNAK